MIDMEVVKQRIRGIIDCGCCPIEEDVVERVAAWLTEGQGHTVEEIDTDGHLRDIIDAVYNYDIFQNKPETLPDVSADV